LSGKNTIKESVHKYPESGKKVKAHINLLALILSQSQIIGIYKEKGNF